MKLSNQNDIADEILFELIVLSIDVPTEDTLTSLAIIAKLSELPQDVSAYVVESGIQLIGTSGGYEKWKLIYSDALIINDKIELAELLNARAQQL